MGIQRSDRFYCNETWTVKVFIFPTLKTVDSNRMLNFFKRDFYLFKCGFRFLHVTVACWFLRTRTACFYFLILKNKFRHKERILESGCTVSLITPLFIPWHYDYAWKMLLHPDLLAFLSLGMAALVRTGTVSVPNVTILLTNAMPSFTWSSSIHLAVG